MAMMYDATTLAGAHGLSEVMLSDIAEHAGEGVVSASASIDFAYDQLFLHVRHRLATRRDLDNGDFKRLAWPRIRRAILGDETKSAKFERGERRRLMARGAEARVAKPRKRIA